MCLFMTIYMLTYIDYVHINTSMRGIITNLLIMTMFLH